MSGTHRVVVLAAIIALALVIFFAWYGDTHQQAHPRTPPTSAPQTMPEDEVLIYKGKNGEDLILYSANLTTRELRPQASPRREIHTFVGLPLERETETRQTRVLPTLVSRDRRMVIVTAETIDTTQEENVFSGSPAVIDSTDFLCRRDTKTCSPTDILSLAHNVEPEILWEAWDSENGLLFGHYGGEGIGNSSPVVIFDIRRRSSHKTTGYDARKDEPSLDVPRSALSPSLMQFVMVDTAQEWTVLLYKSDDLSAPYRRYALAMERRDARFDRIHSVAWTQDEKLLALGTDQSIYTLDLETGELLLRFADTTRDESGLYWNWNDIQFSPNGRWIVFVDYEGRSPTDLMPALRALDVTSHIPTAVEITRDGFVGLAKDPPL